MAKNLKLNIKNAQLAEALKLGQIKKIPALKKKKADESSTSNALPEQSEKPTATDAKQQHLPASDPVHAEEAKKTADPSIVAADTAPRPQKPDQTESKTEAPHSKEHIHQQPDHSLKSTPFKSPESDSPQPPPAQDHQTPTPRSDNRQNPAFSQKDSYNSTPRREGGGGYIPGSAPRREGYTPGPRREGGYNQSPPQREGYTPGPRREGGGGYIPGSAPRREGYAPGPRREGGYNQSPPQREGYTPGPRREGGGGYIPGSAPRREGYTPGPRREGGGGYIPGSAPRREGYTPGPRREGGGGYIPGSAPRREGYTPGPRRDGGGGYIPGSAPRREGYTPGPRREGGGGYIPGSAPRREGYTPGPRRDGFTGSPRPSVPGKETSGEPRKTHMPRDVTKAEDPRKTPFKEFREFKPTRKGTSTEKTFDSRDRQGLRADQDELSWRRKRPSHKNKLLEQEEVIRPKELKVRLPITVKDLASEMKLKSSQLIAKLFMKGVIITLNDFIDDETTLQLLGHDFDCAISIDTIEEDRVRITDKTIKQEISESLSTSLILRPPVAAFMGHVDHGKTSLIDIIRKTNLAAGEAGAITQHIGAFKCHTPVGDLTILDTPGHEAFSAMRSRGADVTDIIVLVIAGDEGIRAQTIEAINQAQAAQVPIVVAINKSDKPNFNAETIYRQLADQNLLPEAWGGSIITVNCSAATGDGVKELLEMLALQAEILELKANPTARARGSVIESEMHKGMGAVATILVQNGTLRLGDSIVFAQHYARVKTMQDEHGRNLLEASSSTPVKITGLSGLPEAGSEFIVVSNEKEAKELAEKRSEGKKHAQLQLTKRGSIESLMQDNQTAQKKVLNLILRADVQGSTEALKTSLQKIQSDKAEVNFISIGVGEVSESDIQLAAASKAIILGFHTQIESHAESLIKKLKVTVKMHDIIYHAVDNVRELMLNLLDKIPQETDTGTAEVKTVFKASQLGVIAGCLVTSGTIKRSHQVRLKRNNEIVWKGTIASIKRLQDDVREVSKGFECGILLQNYNDAQEGDELQAFEITYLTQEL